jgi:hypothetical protein
MWLAMNQFPVDESLVCWSPTGTQVKNQSCLTGLHLLWMVPLMLAVAMEPRFNRGITVVRILFLFHSFNVIVYVSLFLSV